MKDKKHVERMISYCEKIQRYMIDVSTILDFSTNEEKADAVILNLQQIGETAKKVSKDLINKNKAIQWKGIKGLRDHIAHEYEGIKYDIIFETSKKDISDLLFQLKQIKY